MTPENFIELVNVATQVATRRNQIMSVFKLENTYYIVDAREWENGRSYGKFLITVEPGQNANELFHLAETFANQT